MNALLARAFNASLEALTLNQTTIIVQCSAVQCGKRLLVVINTANPCTNTTCSLVRADTEPSKPGCHAQKFFTGPLHHYSTRRQNWCACTRTRAAQGGREREGWWGTWAAAQDGRERERAAMLWLVLVPPCTIAVQSNHILYVICSSPTSWGWELLPAFCNCNHQDHYWLVTSP
jgi:hypothetical protein